MRLGCCKCATWVILASCLLSATRAQDVPQLANPGGPPFLDAVIYGYTTSEDGSTPVGEVNRAGVIGGGRFTYTKFTGYGPLTQMGEYDSWECVDPVGSPGAYRAIVTVQVATPDTASGNLLLEQRVYCEYGEVQPTMDLQAWAWSEDPWACPNATERVNFRDWTPPGLNYTCGAPEPQQAQAAAALDGGDAAAGQSVQSDSFEGSVAASVGGSGAVASATGSEQFAVQGQGT